MADFAGRKAALTYRIVEFEPCEAVTLRGENATVVSLELIASHGGGTIPFLAERIAGISPYFNRLDPPITPTEVVDQLRRIHGSDAPFMPEATIPPSLGALTAFYDEGDLAALRSGNAETLFPHFGGATR